MRQAVYSTARLGIYYNLCEYIKYARNNGQNPSSFQRAASSLVAGAIGAILGTPSDLVLVRMQADTVLPLEKRRNYKHIFDAWWRIAREEGVLSWWSGCMPTVARAMVLNLFMLVTYDETKDLLKKHMKKDR